MPNSTTSSQGPTSKKRKVNRSGLDGNPLSKDLQLRALKVSQVTLNRYLHSIQVFEQWCSEHRHVSQRASLDSRVNAYLTHLYEEDAEITVASYLIYGLQLLRCKIPKEQFLVESKQSLAGWRRQSPGKMRIPVPEEFVYDLATLALEQRKLDLAMLLVIQFDGYLRPSEALTLTVQHLNRPQGKRYPHWSLIIAPSTLGQTTKTGKSDDSILLGDHSQNRWIRECLRLWSQTKTDRLFPDITLNAYERWCQQSCDTLQYKSRCVMPHVVRHAAASNDRYHQRRTLLEIQKRGRWQAKASVSRYEKHALLLSSWRQAADRRRKTIETRSQKFIEVSQTTVRLTAKIRTSQSMNGNGQHTSNLTAWI